jgi:hypothetical protein
MFRSTAFAVLSLALGGCAQSVPENAYSVDEVIADISSAKSKLDGKIVEVHGWLGECTGLDCAIYVSREDAEMVAEGDPRSVQWSAAMDRRLAIGADDDFDAIAMMMQFNEVVVRGEINATWHRPPDESGNQFGCLDRCDDIKPKSIQKLLF